MKRLMLTAVVAGIGGWLGSGYLSAQEELPREPVPVVGDNSPRIADQAEPLTRGPVHEAFAQAVTPAAETGLVVPQEPPPLIDEIPPAQRPAGDDIAWIPGYWGWDDDRKDFIWISGIWRAVPPAREWVPGYWSKVTDGYQWISGYWADMRVQEVEYLPAPPETVDAGPSSDSPTGNEIWIPGCWMWQQNKYAWRAGYWAQGNPNWLWTNSHYVYTTRGYIYVNGYWDFLPPQRGVLFTPVYFRGPVPRNYVYSPRVVVNTVALIDHLFLRPNYRHYYFGDYYAANYRGRGILPYFSFHNSRYGYDSIYSYYRWQNRNDRDWDRHVHSRYEDLRDRNEGRPPRDYAAWKELHGRDRDNDRNPLLVNSIQDLGKAQGHDWKLRDMDDKARQTAGRQLHDLDKYRQSRIKIEAVKTARTDNDKRGGGDRVRLLKPPIGDVTRPGGDRPGASVDLPPGNDRPGVDRPGVDRPGVDRPGVDRPGVDRPGVDRPGVDRPGVDRPGVDRPGVDRPGVDRPGHTPPATDDVPRLDRPRNEPKGPPAGRASDGTIEPRDPPKNPRDLPGPLNDIRDRSRDAPKGPARTDPDGDGRPGVTSPRTLPGSDNELPGRTPKPVPGISDRPKVDPPRTAPSDLPKTAPAPREIPKTAPAPREVPKTAPAPRPQPQPRANPQPPRNERPQGNPGGGRPGGGNPGGGNPGKGKKD
jgi:hypothetical protein